MRRSGADDTIDKDARGDHPFRVYATRINDVVHLGDVKKVLAKSP